MGSIKECVYNVTGMHCASCEVLIEKKLIKQLKVEAVEASTPQKQVLIEYRGSKPSIIELNKMFKSEGYSFQEGNKEPLEQEDMEPPLFRINDNGSLVINKNKIKSSLIIPIGLLLIYLIYLLFQRLGIASSVNVNANSALPAFFLFGVVAGLSSCAALVGGIVLSMSKQWYEMHAQSNSFFEKAQPHLLFNIGRIISYLVLGAVLGAIGGVFKISPLFTSIVAIFVSLMMLGLGLQMLGVKAFQKFQFSVPKRFSRYIADENNFSGKYMPFIMGALTFFLPCGFTITAQGLAIASGDPIKGGLMMALFALGTSPMLLFIGLSSTKLYEKSHIAANFMKLVGILVVIFGLSLFNMQLTVLGLPNLNDLNIGSSGSNTAFVNAAAVNINGGSGNTNVNGVAVVGDTNVTNLPPIVDGKQLLKMNASSSGYTPNYLKVKVGVPVRWEITDTGTSGCTNAIISNSLFDGQIPLVNGQVSIKEFTPTKTGKYRFSCWMGMVTGIIEVVDSTNQVTTVQNGNANVPAPNNAVNGSDIIPSGSKGCGCGGGGGSACGASK